MIHLDRPSAKETISIQINSYAWDILTKIQEKAIVNGEDALSYSDVIMRLSGQLSPTETGGS